MSNSGQHAFVVTQVGEKGSPERKRADEISDYVIKPILEEFELGLVRADRDPTPGQITTQMLRSLLEARLVIADLTGRNANVYYEVAVAHSFSRPIVSLVDSAKNVAFDIKDERLIEMGDYEGVLSVPQAEDAKRRLRESIEAVLVDGFVPSSVVAEVAAARSIDQLAPENPVASELAAIRDAIEEVRGMMRPRSVVPRSMQEDVRSMKSAIEEWVAVHNISPDDVSNLSTDHTSTSFDKWVAEIAARQTFSPPSAPSDDDVPF